MGRGGLDELGWKRGADEERSRGENAFAADLVLAASMVENDLARGGGRVKGCLTVGFIGQ